MICWGGGYQRKPCHKEVLTNSYNGCLVSWSLEFTSMASRVRDMGASCITCFEDTIECASCSTHSTKNGVLYSTIIMATHTVLNYLWLYTLSLPADIVPFIFLSWYWVSLADTYAIIHLEICKRILSISSPALSLLTIGNWKHKWWKTTAEKVGWCTRDT